MPLAVCATPIGNLDDVTLRLLEELQSADVILCEDTRHTRTLLDRHSVSGAKLLSYHEHNEARTTPRLVERLLNGESLALVSDAGMPGINDPGGRIVRAARDFLARWRGPPRGARFDVVAVLDRPAGPLVSHIPNAFDAGA